MHPAITQAAAQSRIDEMRRSAQVQRHAANARARRYVAVSRAFSGRRLRERASSRPALA